MTVLGWSETGFRWLMRAYPAHFRRQHGLALFELFRDEARARYAARGAVAVAALLMVSAIDIARTAPGVWMSAERKRWTWPPILRGWRTDLRAALKQLRRSPGFVMTAAGMLAVGMGANLTVFHFADAVLLRPLARVEPDRVVRLTARLAGGLTTNRFVNAERLALRDRADTFSAVAAVTQEAFVLAAGGARTEILAEIVSGEYLSVLGAEMAAGRPIGDADDQPGAEAVVVLSEPLWRRRFNADASVVGRTVVLNGVTRTVIGVASARFNGSFVGAPVDAWTPLATATRELGEDWAVDRTRRQLFLIATLAPGVSIREAAARAQFLTSAFADVAPAIRLEHIDVVPGTLVFGRQRELARIFLALLLGLVALVLAVVCANVANLMLARLFGRRRELAIRTALGASRLQLVRLVALEGAVLAVLATIGALVISQRATALLARLQLLPTLMLRFDTRFDWRVGAFTFGIGMASVIVVVAAAALQIAQPQLRPALSEDSAGSIGAGPRSWLRAVLGAGQVAVSLLLLVGAALFFRSVKNAEAIELGFDPRRVVVADADHIGRTDPSEVRDFFSRVLRRLESDQVIEAAAVSSRAPLDSSTPITHVEANRPIDATRASAMPTASFLIISPGFFDVVRIPIVEGRRFTTRDDEAATPVAIVNETLARRMWPGDSAVGKRLWLDGNAATGPCVVIGVARNSRYLTLGEDGQAHVYRPFAQQPQTGMSVLTRSQERTDRAIARIQDALAATGPTVQGFFPRTLDQHVAVSLLPIRLVAQISFVAAALGAVLATVGLYALVAFFVSERTQEIGLRMALGATPAALVRTVLRGAVLLGAGGLAIGIPAALASTHLLRTLLYGVSPADPTSFAACSGVVVAMIAVACVAPCIRIVRLDPLNALRCS